MPIFRIRKEPFTWIITRKKKVELRKGRAKKGPNAIFMSGRNRIVKAKIIRRQEGKLGELFDSFDFQSIVPTATNLDDALKYIKRIYPSVEGTFTAYEIEIQENRTASTATSA